MDDAISVRYNPVFADECRRVARELGAVLVAEHGAAAAFHIEVDGRGLALYCDGDAAPWRVDLDAARVAGGRAGGRGAGGADPLLRALRGAATVVDATAGWGADAAHLARAGCRVTAVEKNPLAATMLLHALQRCSDAVVRARLTVVRGDSVVYLRDLAAACAPPPDAVYLDPMYPRSAKSAAAKKPAALLRKITGATPDSAALFAQAMAVAAHRVVVKRPRRAPPLAPGKVGETCGKLVRFDIYHPQ